MNKNYYRLAMEDLNRRTKIVGKFKSIESKKTGNYNISINGDEACFFNLKENRLSSFFRKFIDRKDEILNDIEFKCLIDLIKSEHEFKNKKVTMNPEKE